MNIVIVGDGKVGYALSEQLSAEGHNITIIDSNLQALNQTTETLDVMGVHGNGASCAVQLEAGVPEADLLIAATSTDELNMLCCLIAKLLGTCNTIARIRNPEYMSQLPLLKEQLGLSLAINPEREAARAIARVIKFPRATMIETFARGQVEIMEFRLPDNSPAINQQVMDLSFDKHNNKMLICMVERNGEVHIPNGQFVIQKGDRLHITGETHSMAVFLNSVGAINYRIRSLMIVGGGRIAYYLAKMLDDRHYQIKFIEKNQVRCEALCEAFPRATVIHGDGSDIDLLESEGLDNVDAFVALTGMDEENLMTAMMANQKKVPKVVVKINRTSYMPVIEKMDIDSVVSPKLITADEITQYVRATQNGMGSKVDTLYRLADGRIEALEFTVGEQTQHLGKTLSHLPLKPNLLIAVIVRKGKVMIPHGNDSIEKGDSIVIIANRHVLTDLNDIFKE